MTGIDSAVAGLEGTDMEARRVRRALARVDATVQFVAEIDTQIRAATRPRPRVERPPQPHVHRLGTDNGEAEKSDDPTVSPSWVTLWTLRCLLPFCQRSRPPGFRTVMAWSAANTIPFDV